MPHTPEQGKPRIFRRSVPKAGVIGYPPGSVMTVSFRRMPRITECFGALFFRFRGFNGFGI